MENNPIQIMLDEHEIISLAKEMVDALDGYWEKDEEDCEKQLRALLTFFKEYADGFHHFKEEQILFPEMTNQVDFTLSELIDELLEHHANFRQYAAEIRAALDNKTYERAHKHLKFYLNELLDHIAVENDELFVIAENLFTEDQLETIFFRFKDSDAELGEEKKRNFEKWVSSWLEIHPS